MSARVGLFSVDAPWPNLGLLLKSHEDCQGGRDDGCKEWNDFKSLEKDAVAGLRAQPGAGGGAGGAWVVTALSQALRARTVLRM